LSHRADKKFYCGMDCHNAYSVRNVERVKTIGGTNASREFYVITLRSHFDQRTLAPWGEAVPSARIRQR
jgi:hypothetical protein